MIAAAPGACKSFASKSQDDAESNAQVAQRIEKAAQNAAQHPRAENRNDQQETKQAPAGQGLVRRNAATCQNVQAVQVAGTGFEPATSRL